MNDYTIFSQSTSETDERTKFVACVEEITGELRKREARWCVPVMEERSVVACAPDHPLE